LIKKPIEIIYKELKKYSNPKKAKWLENYVKHDIKSLGVGIPEIRSIIQRVYKQNKLNEFSPADQKIFLDELMKQNYAEDKLAAILYTQIFLKDPYPKFQLSMISNWFNKKWIYDWNVCDWLCVRLLSPLIDKYPEQTIFELRKWNKDEYLWKARASLVPFAQCKSLKEHINIVERFSEILIRREERFCKTAVGWVLRQVSKFNKKFVIDFLVINKQYVTSEVINNAKKYFN
jgi:3-methyladenine DNA glycosylase AlkD